LQVELDLAGLSEPFKAMLASLAGVTPREEITLTQIPAPKGIAPEAFALAAEIKHQTASDHGVSRLVFCRDPEQPEGWNSEFRIIGYAKSPIETEMAKDDYLSALPWEWLKDSLRENGASFAFEAGTTTTVVSTGHGSLVGQPQHAELEIRASWAPVGLDLTPHLQGWIELLALISGLPPKDSKVVRLA
jgi:hypothetical protein